MIGMILCILVLLGLSLITIVSKLVSLSYGPFGLLVMLANIPYETIVKKMRMQRVTADGLALAFLSLCWWGVAGPIAGLLFALTFSAVWVHSLIEDGKAVRSDPAEQDRDFIGEIPIPHPRIIVMVRGPVLTWGRVCNLGDWPVERAASYELLILNPTVVEPQVPLRISINQIAPSIKISGLPSDGVAAPESGGVVKIPFTLTAASTSSRHSDVSLSVSVGTFRVNKRLRVRSIFEFSDSRIERVEINRWQGGALAGFAWRGDMDMYDPATFQSVEGLRRAFDLSRRFRMASTMFLSGRLSLDKTEHRSFGEHLGVDRNTDGIDGFIRFMRDEVTMGHKIDFPCTTKKPFAVEVGNHMYLHYGTHAVMAPENNWTNRATILAGRYPWQSEEVGSFAEQRDNAITNMNIVRDKLGIEMKTWGVPGRDYDSHTPEAVEASGMEVGSDTNASAWTNVLRLPPPHHPAKCNHLVELTKKYPGDSDNIYKIAMLKFWLWLARCRRGTFVFMAHHHLLRYEGRACLGMTEHFFRFVMEQDGFYISTLYGLGSYWEKVLCPEHRCVKTTLSAGMKLEASNSGDTQLDQIPVEIHFSGGRCMLLLADIPPNETVPLSLLK